MVFSRVSPVGLSLHKKQGDAQKASKGRKQKKNRPLASLFKLAGLYLEQGQFVQTVSKLLQAYRKNPYEESITELLLTLYRERGE